MTTHLDRSLEPAAHRIHLHRTETVPVTRIELFALRDGARVVRRLQELYPRSQELEAWHHLFYATQDAMKQVLALPDFKSTDDWTATLIA
ncbi:MAG: hypothetical protein KAI47_04095, partial [Deltaproteobacteria bacterium]|nr:hypothetical protein [Deltaproteobacteria bacterium]